MPGGALAAARAPGLFASRVQSTVINSGAAGHGRRISLSHCAAQPMTSAQDLLQCVQDARSSFVELYFERPAALHAIESEISLAPGSDPLHELQKLAKIIKAHATKLGIVSAQKRLSDNIKAAREEFQAINDNLFYLLSLMPLFYGQQHSSNDAWPKYFLKLLDTHIMGLLQGVKHVCDETELALQSDGANRASETDDSKRLISIGMVWSACDGLLELATKGKLGTLADHIKASCSLVDDVLQDLENWFQEPSLDGADGFLDDGFESDTEDKQDSKNSINSDQDTGTALSTMKGFLEKWQVNLKLIKLLLSSFVKTIAKVSATGPMKNAKGSALDQLDTLHNQVVRDIDELISDAFMADSSTKLSEFDQSITTLNQDLQNLVKVVKKINANDPNNCKWLDVWESKYVELSETTTSC